MIRIRMTLAALAVSLAGAIQAQNINLDVYFERQAAGGVAMEAHYDLGPGWDPECCDPEEIRWIQMITLIDDHGAPKTDVPGYPHSTFIDPEPGQPGGPFDGLPWYEFTYADAGHTTQQNGKGPYIVDYPSGWGPFGQMEFHAATLVVCTDDVTNTCQMLGGFYWGFNVNVDGVIGRQTPTAVPLDARLAEFNTALDQTPAFAAWEMVAGDPECQLTFTAVPEPASICALAIGLVAICRKRKAAKQ